MLLFWFLPWCSSALLGMSKKVGKKDNLSLNLNQCHHPLITQLSVNKTYIHISNGQKFKPLLLHNCFQYNYSILYLIMIYFLVFQKSHGYEKCACFLDLSKIVRCQRTASKHGDYFEFSLFEDEKKSSKFFHVKSVRFFSNILVCSFWVP